MNGRSRFSRVIVGYNNEIASEHFVDRRGARRTVRVYTGTNKGKVYPYSSKRQDDRDRMKAAVIRTRDAWDWSLDAYMRESAERQYAV